MSVRVTRNGKHIIGDTTDAAFPGNAIIGKKDGVALNAGEVGETISVSASSASLTTSQTSFATLALTAGVWMIYGRFTFSVTSTTGSGYVTAAISTNSSSEDANATNVYQYYPGTLGTALGHRLCIVPRYVNISISTNYFLVCNQGGWGTFTGTVATDSFLRAVRIA